MNKFLEFAQRVGQERAASGGGQQYPYNTQMVQKSALFNPAVTAQIEPKIPETQPAVDTTNAIVSLADMMGPTPGEKAQREAQLRKGRAQMNAWAGLFDGLRHLGNLYATSKGAANQKYTDNPYQQTDAVYQAERQRMDDLENYRRQYAMQLYNLNRQANDDKRKDELHKAQLAYYGARSEKTAAEAEKTRAMDNYYKALEQKNTEQAAYWKARADGYSEEEAYRIAKLQSETDKNNKLGNAAMIRATNSGGKGGGKGGGKPTIAGYTKSGDSTTNKGNGY